MPGNYALRTAALNTAEGIAPVAWQAISIVAFFARIQHLVRTARERTVGTAARAGRIGIPSSLITLLSGIHLAVAARSKQVAAVDFTGDTLRHPRFALFAQQRLNDAVSARTTLMQTVCGTSVEIAIVAIVTLFSFIE